MKTNTLLILALTIFFKVQGQQATVTLPYTQDFEGTTFLPTDWEAFGSNSNAAWQHSTTVGAYGESSGSAFFDNFTTDLSGNYYGMRAVSLDLTGAVKPVLKFDVAYARRNAGTSDILGIWYSLNGTSGWNNIQNFQHTSLTTAPDQATYFTPTATQWDSITVDLISYAGLPFIRLAFENNCNFGNVLYIDNVRFYDEAFTGIEGERIINNNFSIYPNPINSGNFTIDARGKTIQNLTITDQLGQTQKNLSVLKENATAHSIDVQNLAPGIYQVHLQFADETFGTRRIIVQ